MSWGSGAVELAKKLAEYHKELVTTSVRFEELRRQTDKTLGEFKITVQRLEDQTQARELQHTREVADLKAQIDCLHARLNMLSEQALHAVAREAVQGKWIPP